MPQTFDEAFGKGGKGNVHSGGFPTDDEAFYEEGSTTDLPADSYALTHKLFPNGTQYEGVTPADLFLQRVDNSFFYGWTMTKARDAVANGTVHVLSLPPVAFPKVNFDGLNMVKHRDTEGRARRASHTRGPGRGRARRQRRWPFQGGPQGGMQVQVLWRGERPLRGIL